MGCLALGTAGRSQAQEPAPLAPPAQDLVLGPPAAFSAAPGTFTTDLDALIQERAGSVTPAALQPLRDIDALLARARASAAELDEPTALRALAQAERLAQSALALPGATAFYAEVELQLAVTSAQAGLAALAEESLRRAARLCPRRKLLAGEASPELVALAGRIWNQVASAPEGEVPIEVAVPAARVFLDDVEVGAAPTVVRAGVGEHALRVESPGYMAYGARLEIAQGRRASQRITLSPDPLLAAFLRVRSAAALASRRDARELREGSVALLAEAPQLRAVVAVVAEGARAFVVTCSRAGCSDPARYLRGHADEDTLAKRAPSDASDGAPSTHALADARAWLALPTLSAQNTSFEAPAPTRPLWGRWYVWSGLAVLAVGASTLIATLATPAPERKLRVIVVEPAALR